jgi:hypothetical protein
MTLFSSYSDDDGSDDNDDGVDDLWDFHLSLMTAVLRASSARAMSFVLPVSGTSFWRICSSLPPVVAVILVESQVSPP